MPFVSVNKSKATSRKIEQYIKNPEKMDENYYYAVNCDQNNFTSDFNLSRQTYHKAITNDNVKYTSFIMSFDKSVSPEEVNEMTKKFINESKLSCYQVFSTVHVDKESHMHSHIVVSNVAVKTDERYDVKESNSFQLKRSELREMKIQMNEICIERGHYKSVTEVDKKSKISKKENALLHHRGIKHSWKEQLRDNIAAASLASTNLEEFKKMMGEKYKTKVEQDKKGDLRYTPESFKATKSGKIKSVSEKRLGDDYSKDNLQSIFAKNNQLYEENREDIEKNKERIQLSSKSAANDETNKNVLKYEYEKIQDKIDKFYETMPDSYEYQQEFYSRIAELENNKENMEIQMQEKEQRDKLEKNNNNQEIFKESQQMKKIEFER